ncbi:MAG: hypothetical protein QXP36_08940 [Conexivisphaerales archaeon]
MNTPREDLNLDISWQYMKKNTEKDRREVLESALEILNIKYSESSSNEDLVKILNNAIAFPASQDEWEIKRVVESIINMKNYSKGRSAIKQLRKLISYSDED